MLPRYTGNTEARSVDSGEGWLDGRAVKAFVWRMLDVEKSDGSFKYGRSIDSTMRKEVVEFCEAVLKLNSAADSAKGERANNSTANTSDTLIVAVAIASTAISIELENPRVSEVEIGLLAADIWMDPPVGSSNEGPSEKG